MTRTLSHVHAALIAVLVALALGVHAHAAKGAEYGSDLRPVLPAAEN
jgi:hypothetical protein